VVPVIKKFFYGSIAWVVDEYLKLNYSTGGEEFLFAQTGACTAEL